MTGPAGKFRCVILAGERPGGSPLTHHFAVSASVMVPVAGRPSLARVMQAIDDSLEISGGIVCGPARAAVEQDPELRDLLQNPAHQWLEPAAGPAASALSALDTLKHFPALLTTGDHALLNPEIVDTFCRQALTAQPGNDLVIGFVPAELVRAAWPASRRTVLKFADGGYCGANLFAVLNPDARKALEYWRQLEGLRKQPWKIAGHFGLLTLLRYLLKRLSLEDALASLSRAAGCRIGHVRLEFARAAVDVDTVADQQLAERTLAEGS